MELFSLQIPIKVSGKQEATASLQAIGKVGQQVARDISLSFAQTKGGLLVPANEAVKATTSVARVTREATVSAQRYASSAQQMAGALLLIGSQGRVSTESLKQLVTQSAAVAFAFGPTGAFVGAVALATGAIIGHFGRAREEAEKTRVEALATLRQIRYETQLGPAYARATDLENQRNPLDKRLEEARTKLKALLAQQAALAEPPGAMLLLQTAAAAKSVSTLEGELAKLEEQIQASKDSVEELAASESRLIAASELVAKREKEAAEAKKNAIPIYQRIINEIRQQLALEEQLARLRRSPFDIEARTPTGAGAARAAARGQQAVDATREAMAEVFKAGEALKQQIANSIAAGIGNGITEGFRAAFESGSIGEGLRELGRGFLASLGAILKNIGEQFLAANLLAKLALRGLGTGASIAASLGLIALGGVLMGAAGSGGGRAVGGGFVGGSRTVQDESHITRFSVGGSPSTSAPSPVAPVTVNATFLGEPTPQIERWIAKVQSRADRRNIGGNA